ncbi:HET-domain-containing protein [Thozetella sp. PMI_491]|nr:HET-domain-containing protein [Thozetella sp. PMI_491]
MAGSYKYECLANTNTIRVLDLRLENDNQPINVDIRYFSLEHPCPAYCALSYTWGAPDTSGHIFCDGKLFPVSQSLREVLVHLRRFFRKHSALGTVATKAPTLLWIDAICINQEKNEEKGQQIGLMTKIYQYATRVIMWLGSSDETSSTAFKALREWHAVALPHQGSDVSRGRWRDIFRTRFVEDEGIKEKVAATSLLVQRPWFTRAWCFQEVVMAGEDARFLCGDDTLNVNEMMLSFEAISAAGYESMLFGSNPNIRAITSWRKTHSESRDTYAATDTYNLSYLLHFTEGQDATNPRDKIYSLLPLIASTGLSAAQYVATSFPIDYESTVTSVYTNYAKKMMDQDGNFRVLTQCYRGRDNSLHLPSWVPDWSSSESLNVYDKNAPFKDCLHVKGYSRGRIYTIHNVDDFLSRINEASDEAKSLDWLDQLRIQLGLPEFCPMTGNLTAFELMNTLAANNLPGEWQKLSYYDIRSEFPSAFGIESTQSWLYTLDTPLAQSYRNWSSLGESNRGDEREHRRHRAKESNISALEWMGQWSNESEINMQIEFTYKTMLRAPTSLAKRLLLLCFNLVDFLEPGGRMTQAKYYNQHGIQERMAAEILAYTKRIMRNRALFILEDGSFGIGPATMQTGDSLFMLRRGYSPFVLRATSDSKQRNANMDRALTEHYDESHKGKEFTLVGDAHIQPQGGLGRYFANAYEQFVKGEIHMFHTGLPLRFGRKRGAKLRHIVNLLITTEPEETQDVVIV